MRAVLYIRTGKQCMRVMEMEVPEFADYVEIPVHATDFRVQEGFLVGRHSHDRLRFDKMKMEALSREVMGNMFLCNLPDHRRRDLSGV